MFISASIASFHSPMYLCSVCNTPGNISTLMAVTTSCFCSRFNSDSKEPNMLSLDSSQFLDGNLQLVPFPFSLSLLRFRIKSSIAYVVSQESSHKPELHTGDLPVYRFLPDSYQVQPSPLFPSQASPHCSTCCIRRPCH